MGGSGLGKGVVGGGCFDNERLCLSELAVLAAAALANKAGATD